MIGEAPKIVSSEDLIELLSITPKLFSAEKELAIELIVDRSIE